LARALLDRGHEPMFLFPVCERYQKDGELNEEMFEGMRLFSLNRLRVENKPTEIDSYYDYNVSECFKRLLIRERVDVVHFNHTGHSLTYSVESMASKLGVPGVLTLHWYDPLCHRGDLLRPDGTLCDGPEEGIKCASCRTLPPSDDPISIFELLRLKGIGETVKVISNPSRLLAAFRNRVINKISAKKLASQQSVNLISKHKSAYFVRNAYLRHVLSREVDLLISPSEFLRDKFVEWGIPPDRIIRISNGMNVNFFKGFRRTSCDTFRFAFMGRLAWNKGIHVLVEAFNRIHGDNVRLDIYGELDKSLEVRALKYRLGKMVKRKGVNFRGPFDNRRVADVFKEIDVLVVPSIWYENQPLTIQEAFLSRTPVITSDIGGMAELVKNGVNGFLFQVGNAEDLAAKMQRLVDDRFLLEKLIPDPANVVPMEKHAGEIEKIYMKLINEKSRVV